MEPPNNQFAEEELRKEISTLAVEEILALCYAFQQKRERLRLYADVLRKKGGERAQFACCLICFDLARQGEISFQQEWILLADTMRQLAHKQDLVNNLVGGDPYLSFLWELCETQLEEMDPRFAGTPSPETTQPLAALDLLSDADFDEFGISVDEGALWLRFDESVEAFLGGEIGRALYDQDAGFRLHSQRDVERIETFLQELDSLKDIISPARGFRVLVLLFYGTHIRSKSVFGAVNQHKQSLLRDGLQEFLKSGYEMTQVVGVLNPLHAAPDAWEKISDVIIDYMQWTVEEPENAAMGPSAYDPVTRLSQRAAYEGNRRRSDR